jgi:hypothetical protein
MSEQTADVTSVSRPPEVSPPSEVSQPTETASLTEQMDRLSLDQALRDFELANARVLDLTQRLITATNEINGLRHQLESLRIEYGALVASNDEMARSRAFKMARMVSELRRTLRS